jgi:hypothetical protein
VRSTAGTQHRRDRASSRLRRSSSSASPRAPVRRAAAPAGRRRHIDCFRDIRHRSGGVGAPQRRLVPLRSKSTRDQKHEYAKELP